MGILSKRLMADVARSYREKVGLKAAFIRLSGDVITGDDEFKGLANIRRKRNYAIQQSINMGEPYLFRPVPGVMSWVIALEDRRMVHGGLIGGEVLLDTSAGANTSASEPFYDSIKYLKTIGFSGERAESFIVDLEVWPMEKISSASAYLREVFYQISGWRSELMNENRLRMLQQRQINQAIEDQKKKGASALYAFEKERVLLASIRAGDRHNARSILNEMLASIYMSSPKFAVLRARAIELISCLTRAAIEDNPLLEPLIERNHTWTVGLVHAADFEDLSRVLMQALDDFIDEIYLHGQNRSNIKVNKALAYISERFMEPISLRGVAAEVGLSPCRLAHLVKECTGRTVVQIIQHVRVQHAQSLLDRTAKSCAEIAYETGFGDQSYFIMHFKRITGTTPAKYRKGARVA